MKKIVIEGGTPLRGEITVSGAKNAVLPLIASSLLADGVSRICEAPCLADVNTMCQVLEHLGIQVGFSQDNSWLEIDTSTLNGIEPPGELVRKMRASFLLMGPLLARYGAAKMSLPGGCAIGSRPIDLHLKGLEAMGAHFNIGHGYIDAQAQHLRGNRIYLDFPSVGATENLMMAATLAEGATIIENAAEEPEIVDLANFLSAMGAKIKGAGTKVIRIEGVDHLQPVTHVVIPDRIEAGSYMLAAAATGGEMLICNVIDEHLKSVTAKLQESGVEVIEGDEGILVRGPEAISPVNIKTLPYPGFPTDMQAQFMALLSVAKGSSIITETVFENRFMHVAQLRLMAGDIRIEGHSAVINGVSRLKGARVEATDLRAGAAMIIAGLMAEGRTEIENICHIERGYANICQKFEQVGAKIKVVDD